MRFHYSCCTPRPGLIWPAAPGGTHEAEQPLEREAIEAPAQQVGNIGLADAHPLGRSLLSEPGLLDHLVDADDEVSLDHVLVGMGQSEVGKDVAAAVGDGCLFRDRKSTRLNSSHLGI